MSHRERATSWALAALLLAGLLGAACTGDGGGPEGEETLDRVRRQGVVRVGFANEAPYAYIESGTGRLTGEAPEVARLVLARLGEEVRGEEAARTELELEGVLAEFGALIPGLQAERFDVIAAGMYVTPARCREIDFSNPTYCIGEGLLVERGNPEGLHSYDDVRESGATVGVVAGAVELGYARAVGIPDDRIVIFPDPPSAVAGVQTGRVDAYAGTSLTVHDMLRKSEDPDLAAAEPFENPVIDGKVARGCGAFGFRPGDDAFREAFDRHLAEILGSPEHLELLDELGFPREALPGDTTAEELCTPAAQAGA